MDFNGAALCNYGIPVARARVSGRCAGDRARKKNEGR